MLSCSVLSACLRTYGLQPTRLLRPWVFQARVLEWGAIAFSKCYLGISNFLDEISRLSHSIVFLYFFTLITEEGFIISPSFSLELCIQMLISFLFSSLLFTAICKASSDSHFSFSFLFLGDGLDPCLLYNVTNLHP